MSHHKGAQISHHKGAPIPHHEVALISHSKGAPRRFHTLRCDKGKRHEETSSISPAQQVHRVAIRPVRPPISHSDECNYEYRRGSSFGCMDFSCKWKHPHAGRPCAGVASVIAARRSDANRRLPKRLQIREGQGGKRRKRRKRMLELQRKLPDRVTVPMFETVPSPTRFVAICARHPPVRSS